MFLCFLFVVMVVLGNSLKIPRDVNHATRMFSSLMSMNTKELNVNHNLRSPVSVSALSDSIQGYVYYNFYSGKDCTGDVTQQSGVLANTCLPSNDYGIPNNDSFVPLFDSFKVVLTSGKFD